MDRSQGGLIEPMLCVEPGLRLLYVGNTSSYKNLQFLARSLQAVREKVPGVTLFLTCPPHHEMCEWPGVVGLGYLSGDTLSNAYSEATAFITASLVESGNLTLVEALTKGTPVIAADRPYARDLCHDAAVYFNPKDPASAASAIVSVLGSPSIRTSMAQRGMEIASRERHQRPYDQLIIQLSELAGGGLIKREPSVHCEL